MSIATIAIGTDGFYHPSSEDEIIALVKKAYAGGRQIRCRGSAHSMAQAIYTDPATEPNTVSWQTPPEDTDNLNLMLDRYTALL